MWWWRMRITGKQKNDPFVLGHEALDATGCVHGAVHDVMGLE